MNHDLFCDHVAGRSILIDGLADGTLLPVQQTILWELIYHLDGQPNFFRPGEVFNYTLGAEPDEYTRETWICPVCSASHSDLYENEGAL